MGHQSFYPHTTNSFNKHTITMMTKILLITVASILFSNVVCNVVSDIQILKSNDDILDEDTVVKVEITNDRVLETLEPADRTIVCQISSQLKCGTARNGQACTATCTGTCGFLLPRTVSFTCSAVAASTCTSG